MKKSNSKDELKSWMGSLIMAVGIAFVIRSFLFAPYIVEGASMEPTLHNQERIFVNKVSSTESYLRGDIVIIDGEKENIEEKFYVKRIIGLPGDQIEMVNDVLFVNGKKYKEKYLSQNLTDARKLGHRLTGDFGPLTVPKNNYFVLGDNRLHSMDSRNGLGFIHKDSIIGRSEFVFYPFTHIRNVE